MVPSDRRMFETEAGKEKHFPGGKVAMHSMILKPEKCRKFLRVRFDGLKSCTGTDKKHTELDK